MDEAFSGTIRQLQEQVIGMGVDPNCTPQQIGTYMLNHPKVHGAEEILIALLSDRIEREQKKRAWMGKGRNEGKAE